MGQRIPPPSLRISVSRLCLVVLLLRFVTLCVLVLRLLSPHLYESGQVA